MIALDAIRDCRGEDCPVYVKCPYAKVGKCSVEMGYLEAVKRTLLDMVGRDMTQEILNKITLHLMPLFHQLVRFQIHAYSISEVCYTTSRGLLKVHPIFKEIRETIRAIEATQKSLGIDGEYIRALEALKKPGLIPKTTDEDVRDVPGDWRERFNKQGFDNALGLRDEKDKPKLRRAK